MRDTAGSAAAPAARCRNDLRGSFIGVPDFKCNTGHSAAWPLFSLPRLIEISQIGRRLILLDRHHIAVLADEIVVLADADVVIILAAIIEMPDRSRVGFAMVFFGNGPRAGQRIIDRRDFVEKNVLVSLI